MTSEVVQDFKGQQHLTDFPRSEVAADRINHLYEQIVGSVLHGFAIMQEGKIVLANQAFAAFAGLSVSDVIGYPIQQFICTVHPDDRLHLITQLQLQSTMGHVPSSLVVRTNPAAGPDRWLEFYVNRTTFRGKPAIQTSVIDITEHKQAEQAIRDSEQSFRNVTETAADAIVIADQDGGIEYWNGAAVEMFGYAPEDVIGKPISMLVPERMQATLHRVWEQLILVSASHFTGLTTSLHAVRADGSEFPVEVSHATWVRDDRRSFSIIIRDVAEARSVQRRLEAKNRLAAVGQLASGIAHDFNNILGTIILQSEMLLNGPHLSTKDRERLKVIIDQSQHAASLTDQIMDFSDRTVVELAPLDLGPLLQSTKSLLGQMLPENIRVHVSIDEGSFIVNADKARLQQVFTNLALNSRDAMPGGGDIVIGISRKTISLGGLRPFREMGPGEWIRIQVSDTGEGIKPEHLGHVFEPFFTTKPPGEGSGLGLAQVYGIIRQHNGFIDVRSQRGRGATFTIHLPASASILGDDEALEEVLAVGGEEETILVVDDDAFTRDAIREILSGLNYDVLLASDGTEAMDLLKKEQRDIDLVLADVIVPTTGKDDLHVQLRENGVQVPMIVMTGHPLGREDREKLIVENLDWLQKPFSSDTLSRKVRQALDYI